MLRIQDRVRVAQNYIGEVDTAQKTPIPIPMGVLIGVRTPHNIEGRDGGTPHTLEQFIVDMGKVSK